MVGCQVHLRAQISGLRTHGNYDYKTRINTYGSPVEYLPDIKYFSHMLHLVTNINTLLPEPKTYIHGLIQKFPD